MKSRSRSIIGLGGGLVLGLAPAAYASATLSDEQLRAELDTLRARVAELESNESDNWLNERRAEEVKGLIREVLADAQTRASLLETSVMAGHDGKHFFLSSDDGGFLLRIGGQIQIRYTANFRNHSDANPVVDDPQEWGFEVRRAKIDFSGHIASPRLTYEIELAVDRADNSVNADVVTIGYKLMDGLTISGGEFRGPFLREEITDARYQLAVERSLVNEFFTLGYIQGIRAEIEMGEVARLTASINDGDSSGEVDDFEDDDDGEDTFRSVLKTFHEDGADIGLTARIDLKLGGSWDQMRDFSAWSGESPAAFIGAALHWEEGETGDSFFNDDFFTWTVDSSIEAAGFNFFGSVVGLHTQAETPGVDDVDLFGFVFQGGYMVVPDKLEPFLRLEYFDLDNLDEFDTGFDTTVLLLTFGSNYYFAKHDAKFSLDLVWALDTINQSVFGGSSSPFSGLGLLGDDPGEDDQVVLRGQFQLLF